MDFCPKCGRIAEYDSYYNRTYCTSCDWSVKGMSIEPVPREFIEESDMTNRALEYRIDELMGEKEYLHREIEELKAENQQLKTESERHKTVIAELNIENKRLVAKEDAYQFCIRQISGKK